jgi:hypothetical protein
MPETGRRLSDRIIDAFNMAYDKNDLEVAEGLYQVLETALTRHGGKDVGDKREDVEFIRQASDRLSAMRETANAA